TATGGEASGAGSGGEAGGESHPSEGPAPAGQVEVSNETIGGVDLEAPWLIAVTVLASAVLALAVWRVAAPGVLLAIVAFGLAGAILDVREVIHQANDSRASLVVLSATVAALHLGVAGIAATIWRRARRPATVAA